jgi:hypothetical protein
MNHPARDVLAGAGGICRHVRRGRVRAQRIHARPFLEHHEGVGAERGVVRAQALGIDRGRVLDAAVFGVDRQLITDGTYTVAEQAGQVIGCGGWSRRKALLSWAASSALEFNMALNCDLI